MILIIDTSDMEEVKVSLLKDGEVTDSANSLNKKGSQVLLGLIEKILKQNNLNYEDLTGVEIVRGPGSFTGLRVGASVANALGFSLKIPVNNKTSEVELVYT